MRTRMLARDSVCIAIYNLNYTISTYNVAFKPDTGRKENFIKLFHDFVFVSTVDKRAATISKIGICRSSEVKSRLVLAHHNFCRHHHRHGNPRQPTTVAKQQCHSSPVEWADGKCITPHLAHTKQSVKSILMTQTTKSKWFSEFHWWWKSYNIHSKNVSIWPKGWPYSYSCTK